LVTVAFIYNYDIPTDRVMQRETYCTRCKVNVRVANAVYVRLATGRAIIKGKCSSCGLELIKASITPKSSALTSIKKRKSKRFNRMSMP
jgi:hypothetical protein